MAEAEVITAPTPKKRKKAAGIVKSKGLRIEILNNKSPELDALGVFIQSLNKIDKKSSVISGKIVVGGKKKA